MQRKIKKLSIKVEKSCFICPQQGEWMKQKFTINNKGQVFLTAWRNLTKEEFIKGFTTPKGSYSPAVVVREQKNIAKEDAENVLKKAQEILPKYIDSEYEVLICDAIPDEIFIEYEGGEIVKGQIANLTYELDEIEEFYEFLAGETLLENLFFFDEFLDEGEEGEF